MKKYPPKHEKLVIENHTIMRHYFEYNPNLKLSLWQKNTLWNKLSGEIFLGYLIFLTYSFHCLTRDEPDNGLSKIALD